MNSIFEEIKQLKRLFDDISNETSNNKKVALIKGNRDNLLFKVVLKFVYDDFVRTGMSFKTLNAPDNPQLTSPGNYDFVRLMEYVMENNTGKLSTVQMVKDFCNLFDKETADFLKHVFANDLKAGITAKTINKALGKGFIREFGVQLAHPYHKYPDKIVDKQFVLTQKLDGHRCICIVHNGNAVFYTRKGLPIDGLDKQGKEAINLVEQGFGESSYVLDGELLLGNNDELSTKDLFRATSRVLRGQDTDKSHIVYNMFDCLPLDDYNKGESQEAFIDRKRKLIIAYQKAMKSLVNPRLRVVPNLYVGNDMTMIKKLQDTKVKPLDWEGLMINLADGKYQLKRTTNLLKVKEFFDADVLVTDVFEGSGRLKGTLGGIIINYKDNEVRVGSGFSEQERDYYWSHQEELINSVVQIRYFEETNNQKDDSISLRFPTWICKRNDKTVKDISYEI